LIERSVFRFPADRIRNRKCRSDVSARSPVNRPRVLASNSSRAIRVGILEMKDSIVRASHSSARRAAHGSSIGSVFAMRSRRAIATPRLAIAPMPIFGIRPL
jgi:hypothetical protein